LIGVWGNGGQTGVLGQSDTDTGVSGMSGSDTGAGVRALNFGTGPALKVEGPALFSRSGVATIAGTSATPLQSVSIKVSGPPATGGVIATLKTHVPGVHVEAAVSTGLRTWKIWLNQPVASPVDIVWMAIG
jgi:hypothetical protein